MPSTKTYDKYKDSGVEWIGEIPVYWQIDKFSRIFNRITDYVASGSFADIDANVQYLDEPDYAMLVRTADLSGTKDQRVYINKHAYNYLSNSNLFGGELILSNIGSVGNVYIYEPMYEHSSLAPNAIMLDGSKNNKFIYYWLINPLVNDELKKIGGNAVQLKFNKTQLRQFKAVCPPDKEQEQITDYLDKKCWAIDRVVETQKDIIEKLKEYKQSVITEAVTKGLDKSVPLKASGIEWIGEIPQHWEMVKFKKVVVNIADIDHYMPETVDNGYPYLMTGDLKDFASLIDFISCKQISEIDYNSLSTKIHPLKDDVIFARYATIGTICYVDITSDFLVSYSCLTIRPLADKSIGKFLYYYLKSSIFMIDISQYVNSNTQSNVGLDSLKKAHIVLPKKEEQEKIAAYLDKKCGEIDNAIKDKEQLIEKLTEYKKSLIYECVTGKRKVIE